VNQQVAEIIDTYPEVIQTQIIYLRKLIYKVAEQENKIITETLKWNEPSYLVKNGSTIRISWRKSYPRQYAMFFNCKTSLVETFKEFYSQVFKFEGNRAIIFELDDVIAAVELKQCIKLAMNYHKIKHLPLLGG